MPLSCRFATPIPRSRSSSRLARQKDANSKRTNTTRLCMARARPTASIPLSRLLFRVLCQHAHLGQVEHGATSQQLPRSRHRKFFASPNFGSIDTKYSQAMSDILIQSSVAAKLRMSYFLTPTSSLKAQLLHAAPHTSRLRAPVLSPQPRKQLPRPSRMNCLMATLPRSRMRTP